MINLLRIESWLLLALIFLSGPIVLQAQETASNDQPTTSPRIGFVDMDAVLASSRAIRTVMGELDEEIADAQQQIIEKEQQLEDLRNSLRLQSAVLSQEERRARQENALDLVREIEEMNFRLERRMRDSERETIQPVLREVVNTIGETARAEGYDIVLRGEVVLYGVERVNLTPLVIERLDNKLEKLRKAAGHGTPDEETEPSAEDEILPLIP